jgi:hypothetical protein
MFNWIRKFYGHTKKVLGRVKSGIESGAKIFTRGKEIYANAKNFASNLPVVGQVAREVIGKAEDYANKEVKQRLGADFSDLNRAVSTAESAARYLPRG